MLYFAYGSNLSSARLRARVGPITLRGTAVLPTHEHRFSKPGLDGTGKGNISPHTHRSVHGVLYELSPDQLSVLTTFEGGYRRVTLSVLTTADVTPRSAVTFVALSPGNAPAPSQAYLDHYRDGFLEHALPTDYARAVLLDGGDTRPFG